MKIAIFIRITLNIINSILFGLISYLILTHFRAFQNNKFIILFIIVIFNDIFFNKFSNIFITNNKYEVIIFLLFIFLLFLLI
jgi:hypothetical protein